MLWPDESKIKDNFWTEEPHTNQRSCGNVMVWAALQPQGQGSLKSLIPLWIQLYIKDFLKFLDHLPEIWSWIRSGRFNSIMILSMLANPPRNGTERGNTRVTQRPSQSLDFSPSEICVLWVFETGSAKRKPSHILQFKEFYMEDSSASRCLEDNYAKRLQDVISAKMASIYFWDHGYIMKFNWKYAFALLFCWSILHLSVAPPSKMIQFLPVQICWKS